MSTRAARSPKRLPRPWVSIASSVGGGEFMPRRYGRMSAVSSGARMNSSSSDRMRSTIERRRMSETGLFLLLVSAALAVAEAHVPTHGALGALAVACLAGGISLVVAGAGVGTPLALTTGAAVAAIGAVFLWGVGRKGPAPRRSRVRSGAHGPIRRRRGGRAAPP